MYFRCPTNEANGHGQLYCSDQIPVLVLFPVSERAIASHSRSVGMGSCLNCPEIVPGGNDHGADTVHDSLIVGRCPVWVRIGKGPGIYHAIQHLFCPCELLLLHADARPHQTPVRQVGKNPQVDSPGDPLAYIGSDGFGHGVDCIRPHGISCIHDQVGYHHRPEGRFDNPDLDILCPSSHFDEDGVLFVGNLQYFVLLLVQSQPCPVGILNIHRLDLRNHYGTCTAGKEPAPASGEFRRIGNSRHHGRFLHCHGNEVFLPVDDHIRSDPQG